MKGLVYAGLVLNKTYFIAAGIVAVAGTALVSWLGRVFGDDETSIVISIFLLGMQFVVMAIVEEYLARDFEKNIKSRFADYALAGMSKTKFVTAELLKNIISMATAFAVTVLMQLVFMAVNPGMSDANRIFVLAGLAILVGAIDWVCLPLVISLKSAELAGLIVGLCIGFGILMPTMVVFQMYDDVWIKLADFFSNGPVFLCVLATGAAFYALFYLILLNRVRKGDVC